MMSKPILMFVLGAGLMWTGCVSVKLSPNSGAKRAVGVTYQEPKLPFSRQTREDVDAAWKNTRNGNVISYISDCQDPTDPPLDNIVQGVLAGVMELNIESKETLTMLAREGRRVVAVGKVDGVPSKIDLLVFKRNQCIYILNYVGVREVFGDNAREFNRFLESFKAP